jgi:hypothetical protein
LFFPPPISSPTFPLLIPIPLSKEKAIKINFKKAAKKIRYRT